MRYTLFGVLLGCTALLPVAGIAADPTTPPTPTTQVQPPPPPGQPVPGTTTQTGEIRVQQPAPQIHVTQPQPTVSVRQPAPEIIVRQPPPVISVQIPQPEIIVRMPKPEVNVSAPPPQVAVSENKPQVQVEAAKPQVNVSGQQQAANVQMQEAKPAVRYEQTGQPQITVNRGSGQPQIRYEEMAATGQLPAAQPGEPGTGMANAEPVKVSQLQNAELYGEQDKKFGKIDRVVQDATGKTSIVIGHIDGMGGKDIVMPLNNVFMSGDRLVIRGLTDEQAKALPRWTGNDRNVKELDADQSVPVATHA